MENSVLRYGHSDKATVNRVLNRLGLRVECVAANEPIPGSFWGDEEAGLIGDVIYLRDDTPLHSLMHEACHYKCMDSERRASLHTNAGGSQAEENAVCYLQILLADALPQMDRARMCADMDAWGYSFRLGSAARWFKEDAAEVRDWLEQRELIAFAREVTDELAHL
jgi:hypothetical protein